MAGKQTGRKEKPRQEVVIASVSGSEVRVLEAGRRGGGVTPLRWAAASAGGDDTARARALLQALSQAGIRERRLVLSLPARTAVIKRVQLPPAAPEQLPQLVQFEAQRHLPLPVEQLASGFQEVPGTAPGGTEVLLAVARKQDLSRLERSLAQVGLQVEAYGVEALAVTDAYLPGAIPLANGDARLLLSGDGAGLHAQVLQRDRILFNRYLPLNGGSWAADLQRSLTAFSLEHPDDPIGEVVLLGEGDAERISEAVGQPVQRAGAGDAADLPPEWAPLLGLARQWLGMGRYPLRIEPQGKGEQAQSRGRSQTLLAAAGAFALAVLFVGWQMDAQRARGAASAEADRVARQAGQDRKLTDALLQKRETLLQQLQATGGEGAAPDAPPLELLRRVTTLAPAGVWLTQLSYGQERPLQLEGTTRNPALVTTFEQALENTPDFRRVELGFLRSATVSNTAVTHFRIDCTLNTASSAVTAEAGR